jgi:hypothetical protein
MFVLKTTHRIVTDELKDRVRWLEAELARQQSENRDLVNSLASQHRASIPFAAAVPKKKYNMPKAPLSVFQQEKRLTRMRMSDDDRDYPQDLPKQ